MKAFLLRLPKGSEKDPLTPVAVLILKRDDSELGDKKYISIEGYTEEFYVMKNMSGNSDDQFRKSAGFIEERDVEGSLFDLATSLYEAQSIGGRLSDSTPEEQRFLRELREKFNKVLGPDLSGFINEGLTRPREKTYRNP